MPIIELGLVGLIGLAIGSFLNVLISRYQQLETVLYTRSHCSSCQKDIAWYDLVPLLSFVILRARCRHCQEKISWQYPLIELLGAALLLACYLLLGLSPHSIILVSIFYLLLAVAVIDLRHWVIPDALTLPAVLLSFLAIFLTNQGPSFSPVWGALLAGGLLAFFVVASREQWMGAGDISLGVIMGLLGGLNGAIIGLIIAFVLGSLVGLILILFKRKTGKDRIPFGPFLVLGIGVAALWGEPLMNWYLRAVSYY